MKYMLVSLEHAAVAFGLQPARVAFLDHSWQNAESARGNVPNVLKMTRKPSIAEERSLIGCIIPLRLLPTADDFG